MKAMAVVDYLVALLYAGVIAVHALRRPTGRPDKTLPDQQDRGPQW